MYEVTRTGPNYRNLAASGVTVLSLEPMDFWKRRWRMKCDKSSAIPRETARIEITNFLRDEWDAKDFDWFVSRDNPDRHIVVIFTTNAL